MYTLWSEGVIGPYFIKNDDETTVTVNPVRYGHVVTDFVTLSAIEEYDLENMWFQQVGCHMPHNLTEYDFIARDIS